MQTQRARARQSGRDLDVTAINAPVELRRHPAARRLTLRVSRTKRAVILTMPTRCSVHEANTFLHRHIDWVRTCLEDLPIQVPFAHDADMPLRGKTHRIKFAGSNRCGDVVRGDACPDTGAAVLRVAGRVEHAPRRLRDWLIAQAKSDLSDRVAWHARNLSLRPRRITVRDQTTRWGSCSSNGHLSFSWRLILAPPMVLDYLAAHEVAHLAEMNHGPRFWQLVELTMPRLDEAKAWLRAEGMDLHRYG